MRTTNMDQPDIPASFDPSHASLIPIPGLEPSYMNLWSNWSCIKINAATPYGDMAAEAREQFRPTRPPSKTLVRNALDVNARGGGARVGRSGAEKRNATHITVPEMHSSRPRYS